MKGFLKGFSTKGVRPADADDAVEYLRYEVGVPPEVTDVMTNEQVVEAAEAHKREASSN